MHEAATVAGRHPAPVLPSPCLSILGVFSLIGGMMPFVRYTETVEQPKPDEAEMIDKIIASMSRTGETAARRYDHAVRVSHAKSTACLKGQLRPLPDLPDDLRQGLFASPEPRAVLVRLAQGPGELLKDEVSTHRGMAIKVLGVDGPKLAGHEAPTQDFVLASGPVFPNPDAAGFLNSMRLLEAATHTPEAVKQVVAKAALGIGSVFKSFGLDLPSLDFFGHQPIHPLAEPYYSQAAIRYGDYIAKLGVFPSAELKELAQTAIDVGSDPDAFRHAVVEFFRTRDAEFQICVQLCTDLDSMPVEDASVPWRETESPYRAVAVIAIPAQAAYSAARQAYFDDVLSFAPAHSLEIFRPLGSIMRARLRAYDALAAARHARSQIAAHEPRSLDEVPD